MYAIVKTGGKQYRVQEGQTLRIEKIEGDVGTPVHLDHVLLFSDGQQVNVGNPVLGNVSVDGRIVAQDKSKKVIVFKYKRRKRYRRKQGHRQAFTAVAIDRITPDIASAQLDAPPAQADTPPAQTDTPSAQADTPSMQEVSHGA